MENILLSIDWDYFIPIKREWCGSYIENKRNINFVWYKRYLKSKAIGQDLSKLVDTGCEYIGFWNRINKHFNINKDVKMFVSESHKLSYDIAKENNCTQIFSLDAHSDLGYGGLKSLDFEINCANWLGKLFKNKLINKANIIYSPYTYEFKEEFKEINNIFNINYPSLNNLLNYVNVSAIHICRSGAWTPPWLDFKFNKLINSGGFPYKIINCMPRKWNTKNLTLAKKIELLYC